MIQNKKILVLGMARSGISIARFLSRFGNDITITDLKTQDEKILDEFAKLNIKVIITENQEELLDETFDLVIKNPAIRKDNKTVLKAKNLKIDVINEIEASYHFLPKNVKIIAITGSNGKTTTTMITYELLKYTSNRVHLAGNMGIPLSSIIDKIKDNDILVLEISDHQLCDMYNFKSDISVITNLSKVHLDFHNSYEEYKDIKKRIFNNHNEKSIAILNNNDKEVLELCKNIPSKKIFFSSIIKSDAYIKNNKIIYNGEEIISLNDIKIKGNHNYENIMIGIIISKMYGIKNDSIKDFLQKFNGVEHRLEYVKTINGIKFYNDSKSTNNKSTIIALDSFNDPIILIMGGLDRNIAFDEISSHLNNVKAIVCYGETKEKIFTFALENNKKCFVLNNLKEATKKAYEIASNNDIVLLSPACASWDQFPNFEIRGREFKNIIDNL